MYTCTFYIIVPYIINKDNKLWDYINTYVKTKVNDFIWIFKVHMYLWNPCILKTRVFIITIQIQSYKYKPIQLLNVRLADKQRFI